MDDKQIVNLYFSRTEQAIKETKKKYSSFCRKIAFNILSNNEDTDECENDTYLKMWNSITTISVRPIIQNAKVS